jgi:hypothetical protein
MDSAAPFADRRGCSFEGYFAVAVASAPAAPSALAG